MPLIVKSIGGKVNPMQPFVGGRNLSGFTIIN